MLKVQKYPKFKEFTKSRDSYDLATKGFFIKKNILSKYEIKETVKLLDKLINEDLKTYGSEFLRQKGESGQIRALILRDRWFEKFSNSKFIDSTLKEHLISTGILHLMNGIVTTPNAVHNQSSFHRDFPKPFISSRILSLNIFFALTKFNKETGGTWIVPGSHRIETFPKPDIIEKNKIQINCNPGDVLIFDSMIIHGSGTNFSKKKRYAINSQFTYPFIKQQIDLPEFCKKLNISLKSRVNQRIGGWSISPKSIDEFRYGVNGKRTYRSKQG